MKFIISLGLVPLGEHEAHRLKESHPAAAAVATGKPPEAAS